MAAKQRSTRQGEAVKSALCAAEGFRSAQDVYAVLRGRGEAVGLSTVYRHLQAFADEGLADVIRTADGETAYRYCGKAVERHHHHLVCRTCGRTEEVEGRAIERWAVGVAQRYGYADVDHTVELFGICGRCAS